VSIPLLEKVYKLIQSSLSSDFALWGAICYTSKLLTSIVSKVSSLQVLQVSHLVRKCRILTTSVASVTNIILSYCLCCSPNDIIRTVKTPQRLVLKKRNQLTRSTNLLPLEKPLKNGFWRERSPTHCQGVPMLPGPLWGSAQTLYLPFWGSTTFSERFFGLLS
jgi:hypothetical protein